jgi:MFS family permease
MSARPSTPSASGPSRRVSADAPGIVLAIGVLAVGVAMGFGRFSYPLVLPAIDRELLHSYTLAGFLGTVNFLAYLVGTLWVSLAAQRVEPVRLVRLGLVGTALGLVAFATAGGLPLLLAGMFITGLAGAFVWIPMPGIAGSVVSVDRRGFAVGLLGIGMGASMLLASQLAALDHWRDFWAIEAAITLIVLAAAWAWFDPPIAEQAPRQGQMTALRTVPGWRGTSAAYVAYGISYSLYMSYVVAALEHDAGFSARHAATVYGTLGFSVLVGGVLLGRLSDHYGRRSTLIAGYIAMGICPLLVLLGSEPWAVLSALLFGAVLSGVGAVIAAYVADHVHPRAFGPAFGVLTFFFGVAQLAGPQLGGWIADRTGSFRLVFVLSAATAFAGAFAAATLPRPGACEARVIEDARREGRDAGADKRVSR